MWKGLVRSRRSDLESCLLLQHQWNHLIQKKHNRVKYIQFTIMKSREKQQFLTFKRMILEFCIEKCTDVNCRFPFS